MGTESKKSTAKFTMCKFLLDGFCPYRASMGSVFHLGESSRSFMCTHWASRTPSRKRRRSYLGFPIYGGILNGWSIMEHPIKMDDLEVITPISGNLHWNIILNHSNTVSWFFFCVDQLPTFFFPPVLLTQVACQGQILVIFLTQAFIFGYPKKLDSISPVIPYVPVALWPKQWMNLISHVRIDFPHSWICLASSKSTIF